MLWCGANISKAYCSGLELRGRLTLSSGSLYIKQCAAVTIHCLSIRAPPQINDAFPKYEKSSCSSCWRNVV